MPLLRPNVEGSYLCTVDDDVEPTLSLSLGSGAARKGRPRKTRSLARSLARTHELSRAPQAAPTSTSSPLDSEIRHGRHGTREHPRRTPSDPGRSPHRRHGTDGRVLPFFPSSSSSFSCSSSSSSPPLVAGIWVVTRRIGVSRRREDIKVATSGTADRSASGYATLVPLTNQAHKAQPAPRHGQAKLDDRPRERRSDLPSIPRRVGYRYIDIVDLVAVVNCRPKVRPLEATSLTSMTSMIEARVDGGPSGPSRAYGAVRVCHRGCYADGAAGAGFGIVFPSSAVVRSAGWATRWHVSGARRTERRSPRPRRVPVT